MSAINIPDMSVVMRHNGLVPVPFDIDVDTGAPRLDHLEHLLRRYRRAPGKYPGPARSSGTADASSAAAGGSPASASRPPLEPGVAFVLVAHLYGRRFDMALILQLCSRYHGGIQVVEDLAEAFAGLDYTGHPQSDLSLFSFGSIKVGHHPNRKMLHFELITRAGTT